MNVQLDVHVCLGVLVFVRGGAALKPAGSGRHGLLSLVPVLGGRLFYVRCWLQGRRAARVALALDGPVLELLAVSAVEVASSSSRPGCCANRTCYKDQTGEAGQTALDHSTTTSHCSRLYCSDIATHRDSRAPRTQADTALSCWSRQPCGQHAGTHPVLLAVARGARSTLNQA